LYTTCASIFIVLVFCYVVTLFCSGESGEDGVSQYESSANAPKFLIPFDISPH
jgi:hypothetical protein